MNDFEKNMIRELSNKIQGGCDTEVCPGDNGRSFTVTMRVPEGFHERFHHKQLNYAPPIYRASGYLSNNVKSPRMHISGRTKLF